MDFFRHNTDAGTGKFLTESMERFGHFGYAGFFLLLEMYYKKLDTSNKNEIKRCVRFPNKSNLSIKDVQLWYGFHWKVVRQQLRSSKPKIERLLEFCQANAVLLSDSCPGAVRQLSRRSQTVVQEKSDSSSTVPGQLSNKSSTTVSLSICNLLELLPDKMRRRLEKIFEECLEERRGEERRGEERRGEERRGEENELELIPPSPDPPPEPDSHKLVDIWNNHCGKLPKVKVCNSSRKRKCEVRWKEAPGDPEKYWVDIVSRIEKSNFCNGKNQRAWVATFDFLLQPDTHLKVGEGKYDNRTPNNTPPGGGHATFQQKKTAHNAALLQKYSGGKK